MKKRPSRFRRLDEILADLPIDDPLLLTELDGYLTGVAVCAAPIELSEWLPPIWGGSYGEGAPFEDPLDVQLFRDMVVARYDEVLRDLDRGKLNPIFDSDERTGEVLWEEWVGGIAMAMELRPASWTEAEQVGGPERATALAALRTLLDVASNETALTSVEVNAICDTAAASIPGIVTRLYVSRVEPSAKAPVPVTRPGRTGRNEPCPCGSGKKHKRCCGTG